MPDFSHLSDSKRALLERHLQGQVPNPAAVNPGITRQASPGCAPLSFAQEQLLLQDQALEGAPPLFNESFTIHREGPLDLAVLESSFLEILRRHEIWRTSYGMRDGEIVQIVRPVPRAWPLPIVDLSGLAREAREDAASRVASEDAARPFDLKEGPLVRALLLRLGEDKFRLHLTAHQSVIDGLSVFRIFPKELTSLYAAFERREPSPLPELPLQFADFARWQRLLPEQVLQSQRTYWRKQLEDLPVLDWPKHRPRQARQTYRGAINPFVWPGELTQSLRDLATHENATPFCVLLAGASALLHAYTGQDDIVLGTLSPSGRKRSGVQDLLGYFLNPVALRIRPAPHLSFRELLRHTMQVVSDAISHDDVTLQQVAPEMGVAPDPSRHQFFQVAISLGPDVADLPPGWRQTYMDVESGGARWDLYLEFSDRPTGFIGRAQYNPDLFEREDIRLTVSQLEALLAAAAADPGLRLSQLVSEFRER